MNSPAAALQTLPVEAQLVWVPAEQVFDALQVPAAVSVVPLHDCAGQSVLALHWTQAAFAVLHSLLVVFAEQSVVLPVTQLFDALQVAAGVSTAPAHEAAEQSVLALHWTQPFAALHSLFVAMVPQLVCAPAGHAPPMPSQVATAV